MDFRRPQTSDYGQTVHSSGWQKRADERAQKRQDKRDGIDRNDPATIIQALTARIAALEEWQSSFRITGPNAEGSGSVWVVNNPNVTIEGTGSVVCDESGGATVTLDLTAKVS